jgi:hypothetical protein
MLAPVRIRTVLKYFPNPQNLPGDGVKSSVGRNTILQGLLSDALYLRANDPERAEMVR